MTSLTKEQIKKFAKKVNYGKSVDIGFNLKDPLFPAVVYDKKHVELNYKELTTYYNNDIIKMCIGHEIGHINTPNFLSNAKRELAAQYWVILRFYDLKMFKLEILAYRELERWKNFKKYGECSRYRKAYDIFNSN